MSNPLDAPPATSRWWPYQEALVYRLDTPAERMAEPHALPGLDVVYLTAGSIARLFGDEPALKRRFLRFVRQGAVGVAIVHGHQWLSYAWMATPEGRHPYHLPNEMKGHYWIYYCHTRSAFRGHGLVGHAVRLLLAEASCREQLQRVAVYCDVLSDNVASRKAFWRLGFRPSGKLATWRLPKSSLVMGRWDEAATHDAPPMLYRQSS